MQRDLRSLKTSPAINHPNSDPNRTTPSLVLAHMNRSSAVLCSLTMLCFFPIFASEASDSSIENSEKRNVAGWTLHIAPKLLTDEVELTDRAIELLEAQLQEIIRVVPETAVAELKKVPLYFSPE